MRPSVLMDQKRAAVRAATRRCRAANPRVFGSVLRGKDLEGSDLNPLVDALSGATLFDLGGLQPSRKSCSPCQCRSRATCRRGSAHAYWPRHGQCERRPPRRLPRHIRRATADACGFIEGLSKDDFLADNRTQPSTQA